MTLITVQNLSLSFGGRTIFEDIGFQVNEGDRVGLIGPNGTGKTTLLRILAGEAIPDKGNITKARNIRIGYLQQEICKGLDGTVLEHVLHSVPGLRTCRDNIEKLALELEQEKDPARQSELAGRLSHLQYESDHYEISFSSHKAAEILVGLGFVQKDFNAPVEKLSGGWRMRVLLAGLLFQDPDILLLDEPTNHLDFPSVLWLNDFLAEFKHAFLMICHDRKFINQQINRVISLEEEGLRTYTGDYDYYVKTREEEDRLLEAKTRNQEQKVREAERFIERFRSKATKARQAQSKLKMVKKLEIVKTHKKRQVMRFSFPAVERSGDIVVSFKDISKGFGDCFLYRNIDLFIRRGERVAIIGKNGVGKTTLLKMLAGELSPDSGCINFGHNVDMSYYAQHHSEHLNEKRTILEEVWNVAPTYPVSFVRGVCGAFLFSGDDVDKPVGVLSGGERARVLLARMLVKPGNLIVMDEPTNHLDLLSCEVLANALKEYQGTLIFVSHNQGFLNQIATKIWNIDDGSIEEYPGTLEEYMDRLNQQIEESVSPKNEDRLLNGETPKKRRRREAEQRRLQNERLSPIKKKLEEFESRIKELEERERMLSQTLADIEVYQDFQKSGPLISEYNEIKKKLEELMARWEYQQELFEKASKA
ncbi:MAG: ABC-F family ATP-binding cassette domain-containing protein [Pseudomonadota bacterium]